MHKTLSRPTGATALTEEDGWQPITINPGCRAPALVGAGELAAKGAQKAAPAIRDMFDEAGQAADQRIAERSQDTGTTLNVGVDPTPGGGCSA